ncbi:MAG: hypothetical protein ACOX68_05775 [Candidatus Limivicinus sp.]
MPEPVVDAYVEKLNSDQLGDTILATLSDMPHEAQTDEECRDVVLSILDEEITYNRSTSSDPALNAYALRCGKSSFGKVYLIKDETKSPNFTFLGKEFELPYDLRPWLVYKEEFDFTGLYTTIEVTVPAAYSVQINGKTLGSEYIKEKDIPFDSLKNYYSVVPNLPTKVTYRFENAIGPLEPEIFDEQGEHYTVDPERDDSQYIKECSEEQMRPLDNFCSGFVGAYLKYISGIYGKNSPGAYSGLTQYLELGSDLDKRMQQAVDGLMWAHTNSFRLDSYELVSAMDMGSGFYVCRVKAETTSATQANGEQHDEIELNVVVRDSGSEIRALSLA